MTSEHGSRFARIAYRIDAALGFGACGILFCMMALTFVDVVARYLANRSIPGSFEITEILMAVLIFAGLPLVSRRGEHVTVDLIDHLVIGARARRLHRALIELASGVLLLGLAWLLWNKAVQTAGYGDTTTVLLIRLAPIVYAMTAFLALAGVVHLIRAFTPAALGESDLTRHREDA
jgi:TRAP-type C4-dicarboxylate transport system permease small subunit